MAILNKPQSVRLRVRKKIYMLGWLRSLIPSWLLFSGKYKILGDLLKHDIEALREHVKNVPVVAFTKNELLLLFHIVKNSQISEKRFHSELSELALWFLAGHAASQKQILNALDFSNDANIAHKVLAYRGIANVFLDTLHIARQDGTTEQFFLKIMPSANAHHELRKQIQGLGIQVPVEVWQGTMGCFSACCYRFIPGGHPKLNNRAQFYAIINLSRKLSTLRIGKQSQKMTTLLSTKIEQAQPKLEKEEWKRLKRNRERLTARREELLSAFAELPIGFNHNDFTVANLLVHNGTLILLDYAGGSMKAKGSDMAVFIYSALEPLSRLYAGSAKDCIADATKHFYDPINDSSFLRFAEMFFLIVGLNQTIYQLVNGRNMYLKHARQRFATYNQLIEKALLEE